MRIWILAIAITGLGFFLAIRHLWGWLALNFFASLCLGYIMGSSMKEKK